MICVLMSCLVLWDIVRAAQQRAPDCGFHERVEGAQHGVIRVNSRAGTCWAATTAKAA
jgi:hypothetical protein